MRSIVSGCFEYEDIYKWSKRSNDSVNDSSVCLSKSDNSDRYQRHIEN